MKSETKVTGCTYAMLWEWNWEGINVCLVIRAERVTWVYFTMMCACYMCVGVLNHIWAWKLEEKLCVSPCQPLSYFPHTGSHRAESFMSGARLAGKQAPGTLQSPPTAALDWHTYVARPSFYMGTGYLNSDLHFCGSVLTHWAISTAKWSLKCWWVFIVGTTLRLKYRQ